MEFTRAAQVVAGILFHSSIMTSRSCWNVRHMVLLHVPLEDAPHVLNRVQFWRTYLATPTPSPSASSARQLSSWWGVWGGCYVGKQFLKGGHHLLLQNVTVHVGVHVSLNEPASEEAPSGMTPMQTDLLQCVAYGLSTDKLTFHFCNL